MTTFRRLAPAAGLFLLAPLVAEFLLGNLPITLLPALLLLLPLYGGGALVVREVTRRAGRGVPTMLVLGVGYGLLEEGIATQSLFNPHYLGADLLTDGYVEALGIAVPWTIGVLSLHAVWSTTVPIVLVELISGRPRTPWLGRPGLAVAVGLLVLGVLGNGAFQLAQDPFLASPAQLVAVVLAAAVCAVVALRLPRLAPRPGRVPPPLAVAAIALAAGVVDELADLDGWGVAVLVALAVVLGGLAALWTPRAGWTDAHTLAAAAGALLTYAWHAFPQTPAVPVDPAVDLVGNVVFAAGAVLLLGWAARRVTRGAPAPARPPAGRAPR